MAIAHTGSDPAPETIKVKHPGGYALINKSDFDPSQHEPFDADEVPPSDGDPLSGNVAAATAHVEALTDVLALTALLAAESAGAARKGVLKVIDKRLAALTATAE